MARHRAFNKHRRPTKIVAYFVQKSQLFSSKNKSNIREIHVKLVDTVGYSTQTSCQQGGLKLPFTFHSRLLPLSVRVPASLFYFYCKMLRNIANFFLFLPVPTTLGIILPTLSPPTFRTPPTLYSPGLLLPCPPPHCSGETSSGNKNSFHMKYYIVCLFREPGNR